MILKRLPFALIKPSECPHLQAFLRKISSLEAEPDPTTQLPAPICLGPCTGPQESVRIRNYTTARMIEISGIC